MKKNTKNEQRQKRHKKVRMEVIGTADKPRLCVFRSNAHIYGQLIDDTAGRTVASVSDAAIKAGKDDFAKVEKARAAGLELAKKAQALGLVNIVFDRGGYIYTGRVKALAEGAREGGLKF